MNHDPKYNEFEYEKENYPKTPEHFKQFVAAQVTKELSKASIVKHRARKKYFPAKVAAAVIVCAAVGTTGAYAGVKHYQARSQQYLQETGRITAPETSSEEETPAISDNADSVSPATIVSEENGLITTIFGLVVALILQVFYNYILSKIEGLTSEMEDSSITLLDMIPIYLSPRLQCSQALQIHPLS